MRATNITVQQGAPHLYLLSEAGRLPFPRWRPGRALACASMARLQDATSASDARTSSARNWTSVLTSARRSPTLFHTSERCGKFPPKKDHKRPEPKHGDRKVPRQAP